MRDDAQTSVVSVPSSAVVEAAVVPGGDVAAKLRAGSMLRITAHVQRTCPRRCVPESVTSLMESVCASVCSVYAVYDGVRGCWSRCAHICPVGGPTWGVCAVTDV